MDELVKQLWECASGECFNCSQYTPNTNASVCSKELMKQAADAIDNLSKLNAEITKRELKQRMSKPCWIPVTEALPDAGKRVLCYCRANIYEVMKMRTDGDWVYDMNHVYMHSFVTHWMSLPQPPKEE